jgi:Cdc6-like AAA superfamily ATPase
MSIKLLVAGESNSGKTTLTKDLTDVLVVSCDGKRFPYPKPHVLIPSFSSADELIQIVTDKIVAYKEKYKELPKTVVFDSVSRIFDIMYDNCNVKFTGFTIYSELDKSIKTFTNFVEDSIVASDINVVLISHALWDSETAKYNLVGKGSFAKTGSFLSVVDEAVFLETKNNKRVIHNRSTKFPARTLQEDLADSLPVEDFNLQSHIDLLASRQEDVSEFSL